MSRPRKKLLAIFVVCSAGTLFQTGFVPTSCVQFYGETVLAALDPCAVFNCTGGTFFNLCEPFPLFWTCPNVGGQP
ncbi:MAG: hypothetical protein ACE5I3_01780 [Phycisphaerae bacterium]